MIDKDKIAKEADVIISGYAINECPEGFRVVNLNNGGHSAVMKKDGTLIETNMDDIELSIATDFVMQSLKYMEARNYA